MMLSRPILAAALTLVIAAIMPHAAQAGDAPDVAAGAALVKQRCALCHAVTAGQKSGFAPNLAGVVGRQAGSTDATGYSPARKASGLVD